MQNEGMKELQEQEAKNRDGSDTMLGQEVTPKINYVYSLRFHLVIYMRE